MTLQEIYWTSGIVIGLIATSLNVVMFTRSRPDKMKAAVQSAIDPLVKRMDTIEVNMRAGSNEQTSQGRKLDRIESDVRHGPSKRDLDALHARISELMKTTSEMKGEQNARFQQVDRVNQHLMKIND